MFVLVTDRSMYYKRERRMLRAALNGSDIEAALADADSAGEFLTSANDPHGPAMRTYGPFATYDEGKCAAMLLGFEADYWVVPLESLTVDEGG